MTATDEREVSEPKTLATSIQNTMQVNSTKTVQNLGASSPLLWSVIRDKTGTAITRESGTFSDLVAHLAEVGTFPDKQSCPWVKGATFGEVRTAQGSLRSNANVLSVSAVEIDYDGGCVPLAQGKAMLESAGIRAALYPSPSSTAEKPRWRVIAPLSSPTAPSARTGLVARLNGALGGIASPESFTLSQGFYYGGTPTNDYAVAVTFDSPSSGRCVDQLPALDATAIGKTGKAISEDPTKKLDSHFDVLVSPDVARDLRSALTALNADDRAQWIDIGHALKTLGEPGYELWLEWSATSDKYDPQDAADKWGSLQPIQTGYQAVFAKAQAAGWTNPKSHSLDPISADAFDDLVQAAKAAPAPRYRLLRSADIAALPPLVWRVRGVLPSVGLAAGYGPSGSGKSFLFFDMAAAIASGERWFGCRVEAAPVVYLVLEGEGGLNRRVRAWEEHKGRTLPDALACVVQPFALTVAQDLADMAAVVPAGAVVFIDTLNRAAPTADENSSKDMGAILQAAKSLQAATGGLVVLIHHTGKDASKGLRGHSSLFAAMDAAVEVSRDGDSREWKIAKAKDGQDGRAHPFALEALTLHVDAHGDAETSCVVLPQAVDVGTKGKKLTRQAVIAFDALHQCLARNGAKPPQSVRDYLGNGACPDKCITEKEWREACYLGGIAESDAVPDSKRRSFGRARNALLNANRVGTHDGRVWVI